MMTDITFNLLIFLSIFSIKMCTCWNTQPNTVVNLKETIREVTRFNGNADTSVPEDFRILMVDGEQMLVGARNRVYVITLSGLEQRDVIEWMPSEAHVQTCMARMKTKEDCQNYIRVIVKKSDNQVVICGTNAFQPWCRTYAKDNAGFTDFPIGNYNGVGVCPFDPKHNNTAIFTDSRLFSATVTDFAGTDSLIYGKPVEYTADPPQLRTEPHSSEVLNEPNFVSSYVFQDKVYFFFRETAVEAINCGKTTYSRVGRVCKNDRGGEYILQKSWTSFFKSRLNCSMPGDFPFYFDEIESTSDIGKGNYMPSITMDNRTDMVYAVFNTPENSIHGSAVCAFRFHDIVSSFEGAFKEQKGRHANWLPLAEDETPQPHPAKSCSNGSLSDQTLNFINTHPLMDQAVPAFGGKPVLISTSFKFRLSVIAVDWQVYAADNKRYDVLFIGTNDGRVVKAINKGGGSDNMQTIIIEDIQVFDNKSPVVNIQVHRDDERLMVVSKYEIKSILLQRCHHQQTCSECVALQDPYCSWHEGICRFSRNGLQSIDTAKHHRCKDSTLTTKKVTTTPVVPTCAPCPVCTGSPPQKDQPVAAAGTTVAGPHNTNTPRPDQKLVSSFTTDMSNEIPRMAAEPNTGAMKSGSNLKYAAHDMAIAILFTMLLMLIVGFVLGYVVSERQIMTCTTPCGVWGRRHNPGKCDEESDDGIKKNCDHHHHHHHNTNSNKYDEKNLNKKNDNRYENPQQVLSHAPSNHHLQHLQQLQQQSPQPHLQHHPNMHSTPPPAHHPPGIPGSLPPPPLPPIHHQQQNSLSSLDNNSRSQLNVVLNDISGKKSPGKALNENVETSLTPSKIKKQVYL